MDHLTGAAVLAAQNGLASCCKFLTANDTGLTGGHQAGIHIAKSCWPVLFDREGVKGENMERPIRIQWHDGVITYSQAYYYGQKTRNEYRLTRFGRGFEWIGPEHTGSLFVLTRQSADDYQAFVLDTEDSIADFLAGVGLTETQTGRLIGLSYINPFEVERREINSYINSLTEDFPSSYAMSDAARRIHRVAYNHIEQERTDPDSRLIDWTDLEFRLFQALEAVRFGGVIRLGFSNVEGFIMLANQVLNRRKSRAGKSLEHHLAALLKSNGVRFAEQAVTEGNKRPDFIFPSADAYHSLSFPDSRLATLAAKTTCKDRWRQVINEADRLKGKPKYLCTLQQGISPAQMDEMQAENVVLVVPKPYIRCYPEDRRDRILTLADFIGMIREMEGV